MGNDMMMNRMKWRRTAAAFFALAFAPGIAQADQGAAQTGKSGLYISLAGLHVMPSDIDSSYQAASGISLARTAPLDNKPGFAAAVGYEMDSGFRVEIELGDRSASWDKYENTVITFAGRSIPVGGQNIRGSLKTRSLMANGIFAIDTGWKIRPYFGGGIGLARHKATVEGGYVVSPQGEATPYEGGASGNDTVVAYQAMLGIAYSLTEKVEARLGYRYFATDDAEMGNPEVIGSTWDYASHNFEAGILFRF